MTSSYLQSLGFVPTIKNAQHAFTNAWRFQYNHLAADGATLFIERPLGTEACQLSELEVPQSPQDIFARVGLNDRPGLAAAMKAFYAAHGGMGRPLPAVADSAFRPLRRQQ